MNRVKKVVLDQFGQPWGFAHVEKGETEIDVFIDMGIDGTPVNIKRHRVTANKRMLKKAESDSSCLYSSFIHYVHNGIDYYRSGWDGEE